MNQKKKNEHGLNQRQQLFCEQYLIHGNAQIAAENAGFKRSYGLGVKRQPAVKEYLTKRREEMAKKDIATADEVLKFLTDVMRGFYTSNNAMSEEEKSIRLAACKELWLRVGLSGSFQQAIGKLEKLNKK